MLDEQLSRLLVQRLYSAARPRSVPASPKVCTGHVREPLRFDKEREREKGFGFGCDRQLGHGHARRRALRSAPVEGHEEQPIGRASLV